MLLYRVITALVLIPFLLGAIFYLTPLGWAFFIGIVVLLMMNEYCGMVAFTLKERVFFLLVCALSIFLLYFYDFGMTLLVSAITLLFWCIFVPIWVHKKWEIRSRIEAFFIGLLIALPTWLSFIYWRPDGSVAWAILIIMSVVWVADTAAYAVGRLYGKHKLAPSISPGKTWEGAVGAVCVVLLYVGSLYYLSVLPIPNFFFVLFIAILMTVISIYGDLLESFFKRNAGIKDSGKLLPGHGGIYDRVDGLVAAVSVTAALSSIVNFYTKL